MSVPAPELIVVDPRHAANALERAVALHAAGTPFDVEVRMAHPGITAALRTCANFEVRYPDPDARLQAYDDLEYRFKIAVDPRDVRDLRALSRRVRAQMRQTIDLARGVHVRSWIEVDVLRTVFQTNIEPVFVAPVIPELPPVEHSMRRDAIVIWAPELRAIDCALYAAAVEDARMSAFIVGASGDRVPGNVQFVTLENAGDVLARAAVIVDASPADPGWAIALARLGRPLVVTNGSGAHEYLDPVVQFRAWKRGDLALAVAHAMGAPEPRLRPLPGTGQTAAPPLPRITVTANNIPVLLADAVARRERGERFDVLFDAGHPYADATAATAAGIIEAEPDAAARAASYEAFAATQVDERGDPAPSVITLPLPMVETLRQCAVLADGLVFRSATEATRINSILGTFDRPASVVAPPAGFVPYPQPREPDGRIVVWARDIPAFALGVVNLALEDIGAPVTIVDDDADCAAQRDALVHASIVVAPAHDHASAALGLAAWHVPLCAPASSGAGEWLERVALYDYGSPASIRAAIAAAFASTPPRARRTPLPPMQALPDSAGSQATGPTVLAIVRVRDGDTAAERTRASVAAQRYPHVEIIEAAGGGGRIARIINAAVAETPAEYVAVIDAGDEWFPDHLDVLVTALERSGRHVAYAETLIAHARPDGKTAGYSLAARRPVEVAALSVFDAMLAAPLRSLIRCEELIEAGGWNDHLPNAGDHELFLRLKKRADFVYIPHVTSRTFRPRGAALTPPPGVLFAEHQLLHLLHPVPGRPALEAKRAEALAYLRTAREFSLTPPPLRLN